MQGSEGGEDGQTVAFKIMMRRGSHGRPRAIQVSTHAIHACKSTDYFPLPKQGPQLIQLEARGGRWLLFPAFTMMGTHISGPGLKCAQVPANLSLAVKSREGSAQDAAERAEMKRLVLEAETRSESNAEDLKGIVQTMLARVNQREPPKSAAGGNPARYNPCTNAILQSKNILAGSQVA